MDEQVETVEIPKVETSVNEETILGTAKAETQETPEQAAAVEAENKRLLDADDKSLKPEELTKKQALVKSQEEAKAQIVPEKYEVKLPDGFQVDEKAMEALTPVFKEMKLTNSQVQKLAETYAPIIKAQVEAQQQAAIAMWNKQGDDWKTESIKMLGANAKQEMVFAAKFMDRFGGKEIVGADGKKTNELRILMEETKIGNNPVMLSAIIAAGKLLGEDKFVEGDPSSSKQNVSIYDHPTSKATLVYKS